jgi:hypothetical protein
MTYRQPKGIAKAGVSRTSLNRADTTRAKAFGKPAKVGFKDEFGSEGSRRAKAFGIKQDRHESNPAKHKPMAQGNVGKTKASAAASSAGRASSKGSRQRRDAKGRFA